YNIYRGVEETSLGFLEMSTKTDFLDSSVLNGQQYYYQVTAFNEHGEGPASGIVTATPGTTPSPPLALAAVAGDSFVQLNWTAPSDDGGFPVEGYNVYRGPDELSLVYIATVGESNFNDTTVTNGITYHYLVKAFNSLGEGDPSDITSAMPATVPSAPMGLQAECGDSYVLLSWLDPEDDGGMEVDGFNLYRGESEQTLSFLTVVYGIQFNDTSVTNGQVYYYRVTGFNAMGEGPMSNMVDALPQVGVVQTIPSAPLDLEVSGGDGCTRLHWHPPEDNGGSIITDYAIYRGTMSGSPSLLTTIGKFLDYKDNSVTNGITYYYQVSAINAIGEGPLSNEASATPNAFTAPSVPGDLMATPGDTRIMLSWSPPEEDGGSEILNYAIYRGTTSESETLLLVIGNVLYYTDTGLTNGLTYYYKVSAINAIGEGPLSSEVNATPFAPTTPSRPLSPQAQAGDSYVLVTWMVPSDDGGSSISGYNIYRGTSSTSLQLLADLGIVQEYNDTSVTNGVTYYYEVAAVNDLGEGQLSDMVNATPQATTVPTVPSAPQDPQCSSGDGYVMIAWDVPADDGGCEITCYNVYRGNDSDNLTLLATVPHPGTSYNDTSVENGHTYYYTITAVNDEGESPQSTTIVDTPDDGGDGEPSDSTIVIVIGVLLAVGVIAVLVFILRK
ncbi:MAG: hypothetical protein GKC03_09635, partial [Methanomassiliicoccales archaeon]|nr:hypothetical protein [Methanomassiliicoccales archaeon]